MGEGGGDSDADNNTISLGQSGADSELKGLLVRLWSLRPGVPPSTASWDPSLEEGLALVLFIICLVSLIVILIFKIPVSSYVW